VVTLEERLSTASDSLRISDEQQRLDDVAGPIGQTIGRDVRPHAVDVVAGRQHRELLVAVRSPLTHPRITTDFCESQLELITGVRCPHPVT